MQTRERLYQICTVVLNIPADQIDISTGPSNCRNWDSLRQMKLVSAIEEEFEIEFDFRDATLISSIGEMEDLVNVLLGR